MQKENAKKSSIRSKPHNNVYGVETQGRWTYENSQSFEEARKLILWITQLWCKCRKQECRNNMQNMHNCMLKVMCLSDYRQVWSSNSKIKVNIRSQHNTLMLRMRMNIQWANLLNPPHIWTYVFILSLLFL